MPKSPHILIVDDDEDDCLLIGQALSESLPTVVSSYVEDGLELLNYLQHCKSNFRDPAAKPCPNLIILDLNMPKMDGREALKRLKTNEQSKLIPIVILTTSTNISDINLCYILGANSYITKPSSYDELVRLMSVIGSYWFSAVHLPLHSEPYFNVKSSLHTTVLIVNDSSFYRKSISNILHKAGHNAIQADDAESALNIYRSNKPDLVILDYELPQFSGREVVAKLKDIDPSVKVIITTADPSHITSDELRSEGLTGVIYKPFGTKATLESVDSAMRNQTPDTANLETGKDS